MKRHVVACVVVFLAVAAFLSGTQAAGTPNPSRTAFAASARQITHGDKVTLTATVSALSSNDGTPSGTVEFFDGATSLGSATLAATDSGMQGSLALTDLGVGPHPISVRYSGDASFAGSVSVPEFVLVLARQ